LFREKSLNTSMAGRWNVRLGLWVIPWTYFLFVVQPWTSLPFAKNDPSANGLKIYSWNFLVSNNELEDVAHHVRKQNADVVVLIELGEHQVDALKKFAKEYACHAWMADGVAGVAVLSRVPNTTFEIIDLAGLKECRQSRLIYLRMINAKRCDCLPCIRDHPGSIP
jgi:endonuclease/exonuclease/phosphatase (EEP) superfamily protein YafD